MSGFLKRPCPRCGYPISLIRRACCAERRKGIIGYVKCKKCGYKEILK